MGASSCPAVRAGLRSLGVHPMMGGIPPKVAWESLRLLGQEVIPALAG